ncbi:MAG: hypothetical protein Q9167_007651 [Letrouitia subvulpina]
MSATVIRGLGIHETDGLCMKVNDANTVDTEPSIQVLACQDGRDNTPSAGSAISDGVEYKIGDGKDLPGKVHAHPSDLQHVDHLHVASCTFCDSKRQASEARTKSISISTESEQDADILNAHVLPTSSNFTTLKVLAED